MKVQFGAGVSCDPGKHYPLHEAAIEARPRFGKLTLPPSFGQDRDRIVPLVRAYQEIDVGERAKRGLRIVKMCHGRAFENPVVQSRVP
jgi:hypothetical protein